MKPIRKKTYYNFMRVMRMIEAKGYDAEESERLTHRIFDDYEACPEGLSILKRVDMIQPNEKLPAPRKKRVQER